MTADQTILKNPTMNPTNAPQSDQRMRSPADLVAIARAAHLVGDQELECSARQMLREQFGIGLTFHQDRKEASRAS